MTLLPAEVPAIPEARAEIVAARLARKVAPLFGVPWPDSARDPSPLGPVTWVTDFTRVTLSEIARGAPLPTRAQSAELVDRVPDGHGWALVERVGVTARQASLPAEIANATLNRYGPDTKAAVVLVAVNRLLEPLRAALTAAIPFLVQDDGEQIPPGPRLAAWASVVVEVFRSQPALVAAGIRARAIQRPLVEAWDVPLGASAAGEPITRCEISGPRTEQLRPDRLELVDDTLADLLLLPAQDGPVVAARQHEVVVGQLLRRLLDVGTLRDASHLWISARGPGQLVMEALFTPASIADRFVDQALRSVLGDEEYQRHTALTATAGERLPALPTAAALTAAGLTVVQRRVTLLALYGAVRQVLQSRQAREHARASIRTWLERLGALVEEGLPGDDPVRAVLRCRVDFTVLDLVRHDESEDPTALVEELLRSSQHCVELFEAGRLDRGAAAEIVSAANRHLDAVRRAPGPAALDPARLDTLVRDRWRAWLRMVEADHEDLTDRRLPALLGHHLHNYASFLASHPDSEPDLAAALRLFDKVVIPARERFVQDTGIVDPLLLSLQMATAATTGLAALAVRAGDEQAARSWAALGHRWISRALAEGSTWAMVDDGTEDGCRFALRALPALLTAHELGATDAEGTRGLVDADRLLTGARRFADSVRSTYNRSQDLDAFAARLARLRTG